MFNLEEFSDSPSVAALTNLSKKDWFRLAVHYELEPRTTSTKSQLQRLVLDYFVEEEIFVLEDVQVQFPSVYNDPEEARIGLERERLRLEILREQNRSKELSIVSQGNKFVPPFDEEHPETFFTQFEKNAVIHKWPQVTWAALLSNVFTGEAKRVYVGLTVTESLDYTTVKNTVLKVYKRVPAHYRKVFRTSQKQPNQTCVEFFREKLEQRKRWVESAQVQGDYQKLLELIVYEEVKSCMPDQLQSYLEGLGKNDLESAGPAADHFMLLYPHVSFRTKSPLSQSALKATHNSVGAKESSTPMPYHLLGRPRFASTVSGESVSREVRAAGSSQVKSVPNQTSCSYCKKPSHTVDKCFLVNTCVYCKKTGHVKDRCPKLTSKNPTHSSPALLASVPNNPVVETVTLTGEIPNLGPDKRDLRDGSGMHPSYGPYCFPGTVSFDEPSQPSCPVTILRDSGSVQTFVAREVISSFPPCQTGNSLRVKGLFSTNEVPLCKVFLKSALISSYVTAGIVDELPVAGVSVILGNDVAGNTMPTHCPPLPANCASLPEQEPSEVSPACVITRSGSHRLAEGALPMPQVVNTPLRDAVDTDNIFPPEVSLADFF